MENEYIDPLTVFAVKKIGVEFSNKKIEKILIDVKDKKLNMIELNYKDINKLKKLNVIEDAKLIIESKDGKMLIYVEFYDKIMEKIVDIGIADNYIDDKDFKVRLFLEKFVEMLSKIPERKITIFVINDNYPVFVRSDNYLGLIASLKPE